MVLALSFVLYPNCLQGGSVNRYIMISGTVREFVGPNNVVDIPTIVRLDTQTGQTWWLQAIPQGGVGWVNIGERGAPPQR